jgi:hypothetical protein
VIQRAEIEPALGRIDDRTGLESLDGCGFVQEALPELVDLKRDVLGRVSAAVSPETIIASTSSTISPKHMADAVRRPERFLVVHWLNPAHIPLVEVVNSDRRPRARSPSGPSPSSRSRQGSRAARLPGFIGPRTQALLMNEAVRLVVQAGVATPEDVDRLQGRHGLATRRSASSSSSMGASTSSTARAGSWLRSATTPFAARLAEEKIARNGSAEDRARLSTARVIRREAFETAKVRICSASSGTGGRRRELLRATDPFPLSRPSTRSSTSFTPRPAAGRLRRRGARAAAARAPPRAFCGECGSTRLTGRPVG